MTSFLKYRLPAWIWTVALSILCLMPGDRIPPEPVINADKIFHAGAFALLALLWAWELYGRPLPLKKAAVGAAIFAVAFGGMIEILQETVAINRSADWIDFLADAGGSVAGAAAFYGLMAWRQERK